MYNETDLISKKYMFQEHREWISLPLLYPLLKKKVRNSLAVQWLGLCALTAKGPGLVPGWGTRIPRAAQCGQKKNKKSSCIAMLRTIPDSSSIFSPQRTKSVFWLLLFFLNIYLFIWLHQVLVAAHGIF